MTSLPPNRRRDTLLRLPLLELDTWHLVVTWGRRTICPKLHAKPLGA
jgi:hypothetical protein